MGRTKIRRHALSGEHIHVVKEGMLVLISDGKPRDNDFCVFVHSVDERSIWSIHKWTSEQTGFVVAFLEITVSVWSSLSVPSSSALTCSLSILVF